MRYTQYVLMALMMVLCAGLIFGCSDDEPTEGPCSNCGIVGFLSIKPDGVSYEFVERTVRVMPYVRINGKWRGGGDEGPCSLSGYTLKCPVAGAGHVTVSMDGRSLKLGFEANEAVTIEGLAFRGTSNISDATSWLSNGFQSWSESGMIALGDAPDEDSMNNALTKWADSEVMREGKEFSWWYSWAGGGSTTILAGAMSTNTFKPWVQFTAQSNEEDGPHLGVVMGNGCTGEQVSLAAGDSLPGELWMLQISNDTAYMLEEYGRSVPSRRHTVQAKADAGWNSWYELWTGVSEEAVLANATKTKEALEGKLPEDMPVRIVIDDGWQEAWGIWDANEKFPSGMDGIAQNLKSQGFEVGIWLAPFMVKADTDLAINHPDWFIEGYQYSIIGGEPNVILDVTNPEAAAHLKATISKIVGWGYDFLKIDFLFGQTVEGGRDMDITGMEAYHKGLSMIREAAGEDVILLAVGAPPLPSFPYVDAWRLGSDIAVSTGSTISWVFMVNQARFIASRWPMCYATLCDADPILLRDLPQEQINYGSWVVALSGGAMFLSDDLRNLDSQRYDWGIDAEKIAFATSGEPAMPVDLFPDSPPEKLTNQIIDSVMDRNTHVLPTTWVLPDGTRVYLNDGDDEKVIEGVTVPGRGAVILP